MRWTLCATDRCFKSAALAPFFRAAKVGGGRCWAALRLVGAPQGGLGHGLGKGVGKWDALCHQTLLSWLRVCSPSMLPDLPPVNLLLQVLPVERGAGLSQFGMQLAQVTRPALLT